MKTTISQRGGLRDTAGYMGVIGVIRDYPGIILRNSKVSSLRVFSEAEPNSGVGCGVYRLGFRV